MPYIAVFFYQSENTSKMVENENKAYSIDTITTNCDTHFIFGFVVSLSIILMSKLLHAMEGQFYIDYNYSEILTYKTYKPLTT